MRWLALLGVVAGCDYVLGLDRRPDAPADASASCEGYERVAGGRYRLVASEETFMVAQRFCALDGAHLAVTPTELELNAIRAYSHEANYDGELWVGLTNMRAPTPMDPFGYEWITDEPATIPTQNLPPWAPGEPANPDTVHCAAMRANIALLDDKLCATRHYFVCECDAFAVKPGF